MILPASIAIKLRQNKPEFAALLESDCSWWAAQVALARNMGPYLSPAEWLAVSEAIKSKLIYDTNRS